MGRDAEGNALYEPSEGDQRLWMALAAGRVGTWEWNLRSGAVTCSTGLELIHSVAPGSFAGTYEAILNQVHPLDRDRFASDIDKALHGSLEYSIEYRAALPGNAVRWIEGSGRVHANAVGEPERLIGICLDITDRRKTLESLSQADERYRSIVGLADEGVWLIDTESRTLYVNWRLSLMLGYTADELIGRKVQQFCFPEDVQAAQSHIEANLRGVPRQFDFRFRHKSGREVIVFASTSPTRVAQGSVIGALGLFWDVSERRNAERALRESEARFQELARSLDDVFWVANPVTGAFLYISPACERIWGRNPEALYANSSEWLADVHPEDRAQVEAHFMGESLDGQFDEEFRILGRDGSLRWIRNRGFPVRDDAGKIVRLTGIAEDITARKNAELSLRISEGKLRALLESASEGIIAIDEHGSILLVNARIEQQFGYAREELIGQPAEVLLPLDLRDGHIAHRRSYLADPRTRAMGRGLSLTAQRKDGTVFPVEVSLSFVQESDSLLVLALVSDITERKRLEQELREAAKLESIGVLAGGLAHDFNNLLTVVLGNASMAMEQLPKGNPVRAFLEPVVRSTERAAELTQQLLAYSGRGRFVIRPVNLSNFTRNLVRLMQVSIPETVRLDLELPAGIPGIEADLAQLQQVVTNLVLNAAEAIGQSAGVLTVRTGVREVKAGQISSSLAASGIVPGRYIYLQVADTGCGMDDNTMQHMFDPFFTTKFTGRGLGLAAVLGIVRGHKGTVEVDSSPGRGSTFTLLFPEAAGESNEPERVEERGSPTGRGTVLVVDGDIAVREMTRTVLEMSGYSVVVVGHAQEALAIFGSMARQVSAVLLDVSLPVGNSMDVLAGFRRINPEVPVVLTSGFSETDTIEHFSGAQIDGFLQKPYTAVRLVEKIRGAVKQS